MIVLAAGVIFVTMLAEAMLAAKHERALRAAGAVEPPDDVYGAMRITYPGYFLLMLFEGSLRSHGADWAFIAGAAVFAAGKALKYWAMATLGSRWTFRVLVPPRGEYIRRGPYRWMAHPNYLGVLGELLGVAIAMHAFYTGPLAVAGFAFLMRRRISVEERALAGE